MKKNQFYFKLKNKIKNKQAKILVIGLGYVGLKLLINLQKNLTLLDTKPIKQKLKYLIKKNPLFLIFLMN